MTIVVWNEKPHATWSAKLSLVLIHIDLTGALKTLLSILTSFGVTYISGHIWWNGGDPHLRLSDTLLVSHKVFSTPNTNPTLLQWGSIHSLF